MTNEWQTTIENMTEMERIALTDKLIADYDNGSDERTIDADQLISMVFDLMGDNEDTREVLEEWAGIDFTQWA